MSNRNEESPVPERNINVDLLNPGEAITSALDDHFSKLRLMKDHLVENYPGKYSREAQEMLNKYRDEKWLLWRIVDSLRRYPQIPIKTTTNIGGDEPLELDLQGMYDFRELKIIEALRLEPDRLHKKAEEARSGALDFMTKHGINLAVLPIVNEYSVQVPQATDLEPTYNLILGERISARYARIDDGKIGNNLAPKILALDTWLERQEMRMSEVE